MKYNSIVVVCMCLFIVFGIVVNCQKMDNKEVKGVQIQIHSSTIEQEQPDNDIQVNDMYDDGDVNLESLYYVDTTQSKPRSKKSVIEQMKDRANKRPDMFDLYDDPLDV